MSAAKLALAVDESVWARIARLRISSLDVLAPQMRTRVLATLAECQGKGVRLDDGRSIALDVIVHETLRTDELQAIYYAQGTSKAKTALWSWHGFALAVDVISREFEWFTGGAAVARWPNAAARERAGHRWFAAVAEVAARHGLAWGGNWTSKDEPHLQFGRCRASPSDISRNAYAAAGGGEAGRRAVWHIVGADAP